MSNSFPRLQNPRGGPLWNNPQSQVRGIAVKKSSSSDRGQRGPKTEHNERDERTVIIDDLKNWQPPTFRPPTLQPHKKSSDLPHHDQEILHAIHKACDFCDKNHLRCTGGPPCTNCALRAIQCVFSRTPYLDNAEITASLAQPHAQRSPSIDSDAPIPSKATKSNGKFTHNIPPAVQDRLENWAIKHGPQLPPCATRDVGTPPSEHKDGSEALWKLKTGEFLNVSMHDIPGYERSPDSVRKYFLIAQGATFGPHIIRFHYACKEKVGYKVWLGIDGDEQGFEKDASVVKGRKSSTKRKRDVDEDSDTDSEIIAIPSNKPRQAKLFTNKTSTPLIATSRLPQNPRALATKFSAREASEMNVRLPRLEQSQVSEDVNSPIVPTRTKRTPKSVATIKDTPHRSEMQQPSKKSTAATMFTPQLSNSELRAHILTNAIFIFYDGDDTVVRNKQFCYCDTITKLFNQARVANIFRNPTYSALALRIHGEEGIKYVAEGDDQDFEEFVESLVEAECWGVDAKGRIKGSCTVELGEMQKR